MGQLDKIDASKAAGPVGIRKAMVMTLVEVSVKTFTQHFSASMDKTKLPEEILTPKVTRMHEDGDTDNIGRNRRVSLTSVMLKTG